MVDSQKMGKASSGGQRIDDHSFWAGAKGKDSVFPDGPHKTKAESSAEGAGSLTKYDDTTERVKSMQVKNTSMAKSRPLKDTFRN
jgi:hypothetical protein